MRIHAQAFGRLHIALIDMHGYFSGRVDGGIGFFISKPSLEIELAKLESNEIIVSHSKNVIVDKEVILEIRNNLQNLKLEKGLGGVEILIKKSIPSHCGFGSKTQFLLSSVIAYHKLYNQPISALEAAKIVNRGGTSGIGVGGFETGGFILDCGHSFKLKNNKFTPSSFSRFIPPPPVVTRIDMPSWPVLIVRPFHKKQHFFGMKEKNFFEVNCPIPLEDVQACSHIILMIIIPAILENDLDKFCNGIEKIQELTWNRLEIKSQPEIILNTMNYLKKIGLNGVGLSSMGPSIYCFQKDLLEKKDFYLANIKKYLTSKNGGEAFITFPSNSGAKFTIMQD